MNIYNIINIFPMSTPLPFVCTSPNSRCDFVPTCSVHGGPRTFEGAQAFASEWDVLLIGGQALCLEKLPPLFVPQDGVHRLQEVFLAVRGTVVKTERFVFR